MSSTSGGDSTHVGGNVRVEGEGCTEACKAPDDYVPVERYSLGTSRSNLLIREGTSKDDPRLVTYHGPPRTENVICLPLHGSVNSLHRGESRTKMLTTERYVNAHD